jgi:plasmid stabilization system protein ParE
LPVIWRSKALADICRIVRYVAADAPVAARRVGQELLLAGDSLILFPVGGGPDARAARENGSSCHLTC